MKNTFVFLRSSIKWNWAQIKSVFVNICDFFAQINTFASELKVFKLAARHIKPIIITLGNTYGLFYNFSLFVRVNARIPSFYLLE